MESKQCLDRCPKCGARNYSLADESYDGGRFMMVFECKKCRTTYYESYDYVCTSWDPDENDD